MKNKYNIIIGFILIIMLLLTYTLLNTEINSIFNNSIRSNDLIASENLNQTNNDNSTNNTAITANTEEDNFKKKVKNTNNKVENILIVGVDAPEIDVILEKEVNNKSTGFRTDTIMVANIDKNSNEVNIVSIPRDSRVLINNRYDKINHAHSYGGINKLIEVIENNFNITIDKYARVDYKAVEEITNDLGGVDVYIKEDMVYSDPTPELGVDINFKSGYHNIKGKDAVRFLRYRSSEGDIFRIKNQQYFLKQLINKIYDYGLIKSTKIILDNSINYVDTNLTFSEILGLINVGLNIEPKDINIYTLKGNYKYINNLSYYIINDLQELRSLIN